MKCVGLGKDKLTTGSFLVSVLSYGHVQEVAKHERSVGVTQH